MQAAEEAAKTIDIADCDITVKDQTYTGKKVKKPEVTVRFGGKALKEGTDYTLAYDKQAVKIGGYELTVKGKGNFRGTKQLAFSVVPKGTAFSKLTGGDKQITLKWKKQADITGYQIEYGLKSDFSEIEKVTVRESRSALSSP